MHSVKDKLKKMRLKPFSVNSFSIRDRIKHKVSQKRWLRCIELKIDPSGNMSMTIYTIHFFLTCVLALTTNNDVKH